MRVIVACERSGVVREEFRKRGHEAWSCDLEPADDGSPFHIMGDALAALYSQPWDLAIGHPPCTFLCNSSVHLLFSDRPQEARRWEELKEAAEFFLKMWRAPIKKMGLENPIMHKYARELIKLEYSQMIQPYAFGEPESKGTCLWLRGLPRLQIATVQEPDLFLPVLAKPECGYWENQTPSGNNKLGGKQAARLRSRTYQGIARAMAEQWG